MDLNRWERQLPLFKQGSSDQKRLLKAKITVIGAGGLGSAFLYYTAAAGIGSLQVIDYQTVEISNLNRQILYSHHDIGRKKVEAAALRLKALNPGIKIETIDDRLENAVSSIERFGPDVIVDCTDNLESRISLNRLCLQLKIPFVYAAIEGWRGLTGAVYPQQSSCFECIFGDKDSVKKVPPVIGVTPGFAGIIEATVAIKMLLDEKPLYNQILFFDLEAFSFKLLRTKRKSGCGACGG